MLAAAALMMLTVGGGAYGYFYAGSVLASDPAVPDAPRAPRHLRGLIGALPVPGDQDVAASLQALAITVATSGSQLPDNRHEFD